MQRSFLDEGFYGDEDVLLGDEADYDETDNRRLHPEDRDVRYIERPTGRWYHLTDIALPKMLTCQGSYKV